MWEYVYSVGALRRVAEDYIELKEYNILPWQTKEVIGRQFATRGEKQSRSPFDTQAIIVADFDRALDAIGKGHWTGDIEDKRFEDFRYFGKLQQAVIADIIFGAKELDAQYELERRGFYRVPQLQGYAYHLMADRLNGEPHHGTKTQFKAKPLDKVIDNRVREGENEL